MLRNFRGELDIAQLVAKFKPGVSEIKPQLSALVLGVRQEAMNGATERYLAAGVPEALAHQVASASNLRLMLSMIQAAESVQAPFGARR